MMSKSHASKTTDIAETNKRAVDHVDAVAHYGRMSYIDPGEALTYGYVHAEAEGGAILDIGVGAGRTVEALRAISTDYTAIDYSEKMVAYTRARFPGSAVLWQDARNMDAFAAARFDLVVFSCGGLDMVAADDRRRIVGEVFRVLRPGGLFVFSTHNLDNRTGPGGASVESRSLRAFVGELRSALGSMRKSQAVRRNRKALATLEERGRDWAIRVAPYHDGSTLIFHTTVPALRRELHAAGFSPEIRVATNEGLWLEAERSATLLFHVVAAKPAG